MRTDMARISWEMGLAPAGAVDYEGLEMWTWFPVGAVITSRALPDQPLPVLPAGAAMLCLLTRIPCGGHDKALEAWVQACRENAEGKGRRLVGRSWRGDAGHGVEERLVHLAEASVVRARRGVWPCLYAEMDVLCLAAASPVPAGAA